MGKDFDQVSEHRSLRDEGSNRPVVKAGASVRPLRRLCLWYICMMVVLITASITATMICSLRMGREMAEKYASQIDATMMVRFEGAMAHLWLEEMISGDPEVDVDQFCEHLDEAEWYANALLEGGANWEGEFTALRDDHQRGDARQTLAGLSEFRAIAEERYAGREDSLIGSQIDQSFDDVFEMFVERAEHVESELRRFMAKDIRTFGYMQKVLIGIVTGLSILVMAVIRLLSKQRARHLLAIRKSTEKIQRQNTFLHDVLESLTQPFYVVDADDYTVKLANSAGCAGDLSENATCHAISHGRDEPCTDGDHPCPLRKVRETGQPTVVEHIHPDSNGNPRYHEIHCYPVMDDEGRVAQVIEHMWDVTDRKLAKKELEKKLHELNQFNKLAVGRELRMIELKKEVDALLRELGKEEKYAAETARIEDIVVANTTGVP